MYFSKEHLVNDHYNWLTTLKESLYTGAPGRRLFDRFNGDQVLFIINCFGESIGKLTLDDGRKMEELISTQLPENTRSEVAVFNWLRGIYLYYQS